jgi:hypothetical protein
VLWYVKICLQKGMCLKQLSFEAFEDRVVILTQQFLTQPVLRVLMEVQPRMCFDCLACYFNIDIVAIMNASERIRVE